MTVHFGTINMRLWSATAEVNIALVIVILYIIYIIYIYIYIYNVYGKSYNVVIDMYDFVVMLFYKKYFIKYL